MSDDHRWFALTVDGRPQVLWMPVNPGETDRQAAERITTIDRTMFGRTTVVHGLFDTKSEAVRRALKETAL
jgi:hypothetical protein